MNAHSNPRYTPMAIGLHWLLALLIIGNFCLGLYMSDLAVSPTRLRLFNWHKWAGVTILALSAIRLLWRLTHRPPALPDSIQRHMPGWQRMAHHGVHALLYLLFFAVPLSGWAMSSAMGYSIVWFGVLPLPDFMPVNKPLAHDLLEPLHVTLAYVLAASVVLHFAAVLKHQLLDHDGLLWRMWPRSA